MLPLLNLETDQSAAELELFWSAAFEQFQDIVLLLDANGKILRSNSAWCNMMQKAQPSQQAHLHELLYNHMFGTAAVQELPLPDLKAWLYPDDVLKLQCVLMNQKPQKLLLPLLLPAQPLAWFSLNFQPLFSTQLPHALLGWCVIGAEQTKLIQTQEQQGAAQRSLNDLLSRLPLMLYRSRNDWNWTMDYVSSGCEQLTGCKSQDLINTPIYGQLIHKDDQQYVWESIQQALQHHTVFSLQYRLLRLDRRIVQVQEVGQGLYSHSDMVLGVEGAVFAV
ncbi:PAS domain-containing protein [Acinetobacter sp. YH12063]|uniref:PAS domain-containing protein n=1 Tax=Acinetobacter sp. YH12063 TaxID=2601061 RepID=UPI0015D237FF|nr:PAS domain-containing protein [Acinetobacter sp. YH12063]